MFLLLVCPLFGKFALADPNRFRQVRMEAYHWRDITKRGENDF